MQRVRISPRTTSRHESQDEGFTIIELVVSLTLVGFVLTTLAGLFYTGMRVAVDNNARTQATGVAVRALESMRVSSYDELGFYENQDNYDPNCDPTEPTADTVTLGEDPPADVKYAPVETIFVPERSLPFTVERCVVWADPSDPALAEGFKKTFVTVTWTIQGRTHSVTEHSIVYPGGLGDYAGPQQHPGTGGGGGGGVTPPAPASVSVSVPADPIGQTQLDVTWSDANTPHHYKAQASTLADFSAVASESPTIDGLTKSIPITGLAPGTSYYVRVIAYGDAEELSPSLPANAPGQYQTLSGAAGSCSVGPLTVTTTGPSNSKVYRTSSGALGVDLGFAASFTGTCPLTYNVVAVGPSPATTERPSAAEAPWTLTGSGTRTATADQDAVIWAPGVYEFQVRQGGTATGSIGSLLVCEYDSKPNYNKKGC